MDAAEQERNLLVETVSWRQGEGFCIFVYRNGRFFTVLAGFQVSASVRSVFSTAFCNHQQAVPQSVG